MPMRGRESRTETRTEALRDRNHRHRDCQCAAPTTQHDREITGPPELLLRVFIGGLVVACWATLLRRRATRSGASFLPACSRGFVIGPRSHLASKICILGIATLLSAQRTALSQGVSAEGSAFVGISPSVPTSQ